MSHDEEWWWWASREGDLKTVDGKELRAQLGSGVLQPDALVWKEGWAEWLQAAEIAELAESLPKDKIRTPVSPRLDASVVSPPAPPLERYDAVRPAPPAPAARKKTLLGLPRSPSAAPPRPAGPPRPATTPLRPGGKSSSAVPPRAGRAPGAPPRPLSSTRPPAAPKPPAAAPKRPLPPRRPSTRPPPPPRRASGRPPPPPPRAAAPVEEAELVEIDAALEDAPDSSKPAAAPTPAPAVKTEPVNTLPDPTTATAPDLTRPDAAPPAVESDPASAADRTRPDASPGKDADAKPATEEAGASSVRPSLIVAVGSTPDAEKPAATTPDAEKPAATTPEPIVPVASDPDNELPTRLMPPVSEAQEPIVPVASDPDHELPTQVMDNSDLESELPTQELDNSDLESALPTQIKLDAPDDAPLPSWSDELDRGSVPDAATAPAAPLPAFPTASEAEAAQAPIAPDPYPGDDAGPSLEPALLGPSPAARRRIMVVVGVVGSALLVLVIAGIVSLVRGGKSGTSPASPASAKLASSKSAAPPAAAGTTSHPVAKAKAASHQACTLAAHATRLADQTAVRVPPYLATAPGGEVALGFATTPTAAIGVKVDPASLDVTQELSRDGQRNVLGVVPLVRGKKLDFAVDRDGSPLQNAHTVDASPPFMIGVTSAGVARAIGYGEPETIWPGAGDQRITEPRVASVKGVGHAVTFRRGGRDGEVRVGWLTPDGGKKTDLVEIKADGPRVGTPNIAVNDRDVLVTFAARPSDDAAWTVRLAQAALGKAPQSSVELDLPAGGPGGDAISPAAVGLPGGRWLIQWTEGKAGSRVVRALTLDSNMKPIGKPVALSPDGRDSGQGALWLVGTHALSVFLVRSDSGYELFGAGLDCP